MSNWKLYIYLWEKALTVYVYIFFQKKKAKAKLLPGSYY